MGGRRGHEPNVKCDQCGRQVRRDKALFIDKMVFANPLERKDVVDESYSRGTFRQMCYCPSCGKHLRVYEKKKRMLEKQRAREAGRPFQRPQRAFDARAIYGLLPPREERPPADAAPARPAPGEAAELQETADAAPGEQPESTEPAAEAPSATREESKA